MADPRTEPAAIEVISMRGIVTLTGEVANWPIREAAETVASQQPGVIKVINDLKVERS
jgi:osmotically-inducible protein OsmY